ncbi:MAG: replication-relaxation family protein [Bacteriovoracaceae bacterium]|nr:replication-relaxation family protein [Bacteriovoracaceae bacterium]
MILTKRDIRLMKFLDYFRYASCTRLCELFFEEKLRVTQRRLKKLYDEELIIREKNFVSGEYVYRLAKLAIDYLRGSGVEAFSVIKKIPWGLWEHEDYILNIVVKMKNYNRNFSFISERSLRRYSKIKNEFVPDLEVVLDNNFSLAIEVEKERKTRKRILQKLQNLHRSNEFQTVLYIVWSYGQIPKNILNSYKNIYEPSFNLMIVSKHIFENNLEEVMRAIMEAPSGDKEKKVLEIKEFEQLEIT